MEPWPTTGDPAFLNRRTQPSHGRSIPPAGTGSARRPASPAPPGTFPAEPGHLGFAGDQPAEDNPAREGSAMFLNCRIGSSGRSFTGWCSGRSSCCCSGAASRASGACDRVSSRRRGSRSGCRRLRIGMWAMAATAWATVITGTWIVPLVPGGTRGSRGGRLRRLCRRGAADRDLLPRDFLKSNVSGDTSPGTTSGWS